MTKPNKKLKLDNLNSDQLRHLFNIIDKISVKESELIRPIIPVREWVNSEYYMGSDGVKKLYPFWKNLICDIFENGPQYNIVVLTGGIGCRPLGMTYYETSAGLLNLDEIQNLLDKKVKIFISTECGCEAIVATHKVGLKKCIKLIFDDREFIGTEDHLLRNKNNEWVRLKDLSIGDLLHYNNSYKEVIHIDYLGYIESGDIEVEGSHTYISDGGFTNHNTGKSTCGLYILLRKLYEISCYRNIAGMFGLMQTSFTAFLYFSLTLYQAERTGYAQLRSIIDGIPYFKENFPRDTHKSSVLDFPENVRIFAGSSTAQMIGMNVLGSILDEANFFGNSSGSDVDYGSVVELHNSIISRQASRFTRNGVNHSLSVVISSSTFQSSYTQTLYERSLTEKSIKYARARLWDIKPKGTYSNNMFYVFAGNEKYDPFIITDTSTLCAKLGVSLDPSLSVKESLVYLNQEYRNLIDEVPMDFFQIYNNNIIQGLQDFSGMSVSSTGKLFSSYSTFEACIDKNIKSLFTKHEFTVETNNNSESNCIQYYLNGIDFPHKECARYLHIDIGVSTDAYGIACCYKRGTKEADGVDVPEYYYDFVLRIVPPPAPKKISISRCHEFIKYMRDNLGLRIGMVSFDQFQSMASRQYLDELGINVQYLSVDRTDEQYLYFVDCLYKNNVHFNKDFADMIHKELFNLNWFRDKRKVDHPGSTATGGTKDIMDGVVGALWNAYKIQDNVSRPDDILNLSMFNSNGSYEEFDNDDYQGYKVISSKYAEDPFSYLMEELNLNPNEF